MAQIKCPKCGEVFTIDESSYAQILTQVRNAEFSKEINERKHRKSRWIKSSNTNNL